MKLLLITVFALTSTLSCFSQKTSYYNTNGIALNGYDVVAYFMRNEAVKGKKDFSLEWSGTEWWFSSKVNLENFKLTPTRYAPQYGGFCAYGCSENHKAPTEPDAFTIINDKLYFNYNVKVKEIWLKDTINRIKLADKYWLSINK